jgi:hypothetical protein
MASYEYEVGDYIFESEKELTDDQIKNVIQDLKKSDIGPQLQQISDDIASEKIGRLEYIKEKAKQGSVNTIILSEALLDTFVVDPIKKIGKEYLDIGEGAPGGVGERFSRNIERLQGVATDVIGTKYDIKAPDFATKMVGTGVEFLSDPFGLLTGLKSVSTAGKTLEAGRRAVGLFGVGAVSEATGEIGDQIEKAITQEEKTTGVGRTLGSFATIVAGAGTQALLEPGVSTVSQVAKKYKAVKEDPDSVSKAYATGAAKNLIELISKEEGVDQLENVVKNFNTISKELDVKQLPLMVTMSDSPVVQSTARNLAKTNPDFRTRVKKEFEQLATELDKNAEKIFGKRYVPTQPVLRKDIQKDLDNLSNRRQVIDEKLDDLSDRFDVEGNLVTKQKIGQAALNLVTARDSIARSERGKVYEAIKQEARQAGAVLPKQSVERIFNFVRENNIRDIFGKGTTTERKIMSYLSPKENKQGEIVFKEMSFDNVDSLKRAINEEQRKNLPSDQMRRLAQLQEVFKEERSKIPGNFNQRLIDIDKEYYEKVGVPFSAEGIKEINATKYAEQVAPVITKNRTALEDFYRVMEGESRQQAEQLVRNSIYSEAHKKAMKPEGLDYKQLNKYLLSKKEVLDLVPDVKKELEDVVNVEATLRLERARIEKQLKDKQTEIADNYLLNNQFKTKEGDVVINYDSLGNKILEDKANLIQFMKQIDMVDDKTKESILKSIRASIVNTARNSKEGMELLTNPKYATQIQDIFGKKYKDDLRRFMTLSDAINKGDTVQLTAKVDKSDLDALGRIVPGLDVPFVTSALRDRISSNFQKFVRIASRVNVRQFRDATDKQLADLLADPKELEKVINTAKTFNFKLDSKEAVLSVFEKFKEVLPIYFYAGTKEAIFDRVEEQQ